MDRLIYTALSGANQALERQAIYSNNIANVSTTGFKAQMATMEALPVKGEGLHTRTISAITTPSSDFTPGSLEQTGRPLDVAIDGDGFLAVHDRDGEEAYTRNGSLTQDEAGVVRSNGRPVLDDGGQPLVLPLAAEISIASDGTISARGAGQAANTIAEVGRFKLVAPDTRELARGEDGLFRRAGHAGAAEGPPAPFAADETVRIVGGALESSNVSPVEAMVSMIDSARTFELQMKSISSMDDNSRSANRLLSLE